ncbi:MAG: 5-oxoprolinase subunit PxpB [Pyrinomonadaceae bacterium MAG19_C2-C3]|nr:5-oxoprolinase subunit PxpB [Pyrinomonadaceae bacterium MAG19_C2-C3]
MKPEIEVCEPEIYPLGETAVIVRFARSMNDEAHDKVKALDDYFKGRDAVGIVECVASFASLAVVYDLAATQNHLMQTKSSLTPFDYIAGLIKRGLENSASFEMEASREIVIPVCYGGEHGQDLEAVARHCRMSPDEVVKLHAGGTYRMLFNGFAPGFAYLAGLDKRLTTPRRDAPRGRVPKGSIGIGNTQTGVYSFATPGGWNLIGRTPRTLFDMMRTPPSLLRSGDTVRFQIVSHEEFETYIRPNAKVEIRLFRGGLPPAVARLNSATDGGRKPASKQVDDFCKRSIVMCL